MGIYASGEDYLETILILCGKNHFVRSVDIANELDYTKPSVSRAMKKLKENGLIDVDQRTGHITLTQSGQEKAEEVFCRHQVLRSFLIDILGVDPKTAESDACKIEHIISEESYSKLRQYYENISRN